MPIDLGQFKKKVEVKPVEKPVIIKKIITKKKSKKPKILDVLESDEMSMDEVRAQYMFVCKKKPKHDSIQTKNYLINKIIKELEKAKRS